MGILATLHGWRSHLFLPTVTITHPRTSITCSLCNSITILLQRTPLSCRLRGFPTMGWRERMAPSLRIRVFQEWTPLQGLVFGRIVVRHTKTSSNTLKGYVRNEEKPRELLPSTTKFETSAHTTVLRMGTARF
jgi:hypothetical protein